MRFYSYSAAKVQGFDSHDNTQLLGFSFPQ